MVTQAGSESLPLLEVAEESLSEDSLLELVSLSREAAWPAVAAADLLPVVWWCYGVVTTNLKVNVGFTKHLDYKYKFYKLKILKGSRHKILYK